MKKINISQDSPEWHEFRRSGIGSSDISAIMGVSPWKGAYSVFEDKLGLSVGFSSFAMQRGKAYEAEAREAVKHITGMDFDPVCCIHEEMPYCIASLDGYNAGDNRILEIKVPMEKNFDSYANHEIPLHYMYQVQWQLFVSGAKACYFFVYCPETKRHHITGVDPDFAVIQALSDAASYFWGNLQEGISPRLSEKDFPDFSSEIDEALIESLKEFRAMKDAAQEGFDLAKKKIIECGDDGSFIAHGVKFIRSTPRATYDIEAMREAGVEVDLYKKISKDIGSYKVILPKEKS